MNISHNYHAFDFTNGIPIEKLAKPKEFRDEIFTNFLCELPSRLLELRKVIPQEIVMDFSYKSLEEIDKWYIDFVYNSYLDGVIPKESLESYSADDTLESSFFRLPMEFRSLAYDLSIYLTETLRRIAIDDIHWVIGHGRVNKAYGYAAAGYPRICAEHLKSVMMECNDVDRGCIPITYLVFKYTYWLANEDGNKSLTFLLASLFRGMFDLSVTDTMPNNLLLPRY